MIDKEANSLAENKNLSILIAMSLIEQIVADIKLLPVDKQEAAYDYVHRLREETSRERKAILDRVFGALSIEEAEEWERNVQSCRTVDVESW